MRDRGLVWAERGLFTLGAVLLGIWLWAMVDGFVAQGNLAGRLASLTDKRPVLRGGVALATRKEARGSGLVGRIEIPRLRLSAMIVEGTTSRALRRGVGHVEDTAFPGEPGNVALAGHRDTFFRRLRGIAPGDTIRLQTPDGSFAYRVTDTMVVPPNRGDLLQRTSSPVLTLVTCYPFNWVGSAPDRFVVRAATAPVPANERSESRPRTASRAPDVLEAASRFPSSPQAKGG